MTVLFTDEETEAQRNERAFPWAYRQEMEELGLKICETCFHT